MYESPFHALAGYAMGGRPINPGDKPEYGAAGPTAAALGVAPGRFSTYWHGRSVASVPLIEEMLLSLSTHVQHDLRLSGTRHGWVVERVALVGGGEE